MGWGMHNVGKFTDAVFAHDSDCHSGHSCLKLTFRGANTNYSQLSHAFIPVDPNKTYTMSAYLKASRQVHGASLQAWFENGGVANQGCGINLTTSWQKVSITFTPGYYTTCGSYTHTNSPAHFVSPFISFVPQAGTGTDYSIFIDNVQLNEGSSAAPYQPAADLEYDLSSNQTANIFTLSDPQPAKLLLNVHKYTPGAINFSGSLQIIDPTGPSEIIVATIPVSISSAPDNFGNFQTQILLPATLSSGFYQAALLEGSAAPLVTISFGVLPPVKTLTSDQSSFGGHYTPTADNITFAQKIGEKWARALDFTGMFLWQLVEPAEGSFDFSESDREVNSLLTAGIQPLGLLYGNPPWAANMINDKTNFKRQLIAYTQATVNHYKDKIKYWEVWNESYNWTLTADFADILKDVYQTIKTTCPDCQVLGINFSAMPDPEVQGVGNFIKGGGVNFSDLIDAHFYPCCSGTTPDSYLQSYIDGNFCGLGSDSVYYATEWFSFDSEECQKGLNAPGQVLNGKRYYDNRGVRTIFKVDKPLWMSESGIINHSLYDPNNNNTEGCQPCTPPYNFKEAARYISQYYAIALGNGIKRLFYYYNAGNAAEPYAPNSMPMREYDGALKPIAIAYAMVERMLDGLTPTAKTETENLKAMTFSDAQNNKTHVVWLKLGKSGTLKFSTPIIKTSIYGKSENVPANTDITLSEDPIYIQGVDTIPVTKTVSEVSTLNKQLFGQSYYGPFSGTVNLDLSTLTSSSNNYDLPLTLKYSDGSTSQSVIKFNYTAPTSSTPTTFSTSSLILTQNIDITCSSHAVSGNYTICTPSFEEKSVTASEDYILATKFTPNLKSCGSMQFRIIYDQAFGVTVTTNPDNSSQTQEIVGLSPKRPGIFSGGAHLIEVQASALTSTCSGGSFNRWSGTLELYKVPMPVLNPLTISPIRSAMVYPHYLKNHQHPEFYDKNHDGSWVPDYDHIIAFAKDLGFNGLVISNLGCNPLDNDYNPSSCSEQFYKDFIKGLMQASVASPIDIVPTINQTATMSGNNPGDWTLMKGYIDQLTNSSLAGTANIKGFYYPYEAPATPAPFRADLIRARKYLNNKGLYLMQIPYYTQEPLPSSIYGYNTAQKDAFDVTTMQNGIHQRNDYTTQVVNDFKQWVQPGSEGGVQIEVRPVGSLSYWQNVYRQMVITRKNMPKHLQAYWLEGVAETGLSQTLFKQFFKGQLFDVTASPEKPASGSQVTYTLTGNPLNEGISKAEIYVDNALKQTCNTPFTSCFYSETIPDGLVGNHTYFAKIDGLLTTETKTYPPLISPTPSALSPLSAPITSQVTSVKIKETSLLLDGTTTSINLSTDASAAGDHVYSLPLTVTYSDNTSATFAIQFNYQPPRQEVVIKTISTAPVPNYPSGSSGQNIQPDKTTGANRYDLNGDGVINSFDFAILLKDWRRGAGSTKEDFNHDGVINSFDYSILKKAVSKQL